MRSTINPEISRRQFIRLTSISGAFLAVGCVPGSGKEEEVMNLSSGHLTNLNQFICISENGQVILFNHRPEMGQGTYQSIPMILAEELEVDMDQVEIRPSDADRERYGSQNVVGSRSIQTQFEVLRKMGAAAREMLVRAASEEWNVSVSECFARSGKVFHEGSDKSLSYGQLVEKASQLPAPETPMLKDPKDFRIIGKSGIRRDIPMKTNGEAVFGLDVQIPDMLFASVERSPLFLGKVIGFNDQEVLAMPGVKKVLKTQRQVWGRTREGVAVVADNYWSAMQARKKLIVQWDTQDLEKHSSESLMQMYRKQSGKPGDTLHEVGNVRNAFSTKGLRHIDASYETPYQSHSPMEPMNAVVSVKGGSVEFWGSTQNPNGIKSQLAKQAGVSEDKVQVNYTFMGGGFGRRSMTDVAEEACDLSMKIMAPVKVVWTREDDLTQGPFRACSLNSLKGSIDKNGNPIAIEHKVIAQEIRNQVGDEMTAGRQLMGGINTDYEIPNFAVKGVLQKHYVPITYWRSVYHSTNTFAHESFIDEMAVKAGRDPVDFRLAMLKNHPRFTKVLKVVAEKTDWYGERQPGTGKGVAIVERSGAFTAMVAEVKRSPDGGIKPSKITTVIDLGICINPDTVKAQAEGSIIMGMTAAFKSGIDIRNGAVVQQNFDTYRMMELHECPEIETFVVESTEPPEGAGESGLPNVAAAITNAIFELTGKRLRRLPFNLTTLT